MDDAMLTTLYTRLSGSKPIGFTALSDDDWREYMRQKKTESRAKRKAVSARGLVPVNADTIRGALADAALAILATDGVGADHIRSVLSKIFRDAPGVPLTVTTYARSGKLKPKLLH